MAKNTGPETREVCVCWGGALLPLASIPFLQTVHELKAEVQSRFYRQQILPEPGQL